jgi:type I restriction enzyme, S subunit
MSQPTLPRTWKWAKLGQLCEITGGGTPSRTVERYYQGHIPWVTVKDMVEGVCTLDDAQEHITEETIEKSATHLIPAASVIAVTRVGLGKAVINSVPVTINQDLKALQPKRQVCAHYLLFALHHYTWQYVRYGQGPTVKGVRQEDLLNLEIPFPPFSFRSGSRKFSRRPTASATSDKRLSVSLRPSYPLPLSRCSAIQGKIPEDTK